MANPFRSDSAGISFQSEFPIFFLSDLEPCWLETSRMIRYFSSHLLFGSRIESSCIFSSWVEFGLGWVEFGLVLGQLN